MSTAIERNKDRERERERQRERERKNASPLTILNKWPQVPIKAPGINL